MSPSPRMHVSTRIKDLIQVHEHCPQRAYVELMVPPDFGTVTAVYFTTVSRDQGGHPSTILRTSPEPKWCELLGRPSQVVKISKTP
jgi:hypothetical protein